MLEPILSTLHLDGVKPFPEYPLAVAIYVFGCIIFLVLLRLLLKRILPAITTPVLLFFLAVLIAPTFIEGNPSYIAPAWVGIFLGVVTHDVHLVWICIAPILLTLGATIMIALGLHKSYQFYQTKLQS